MPRCACASEVYGSVFVCVCVCVCVCGVCLSVCLSVCLAATAAQGSVKSFYRLLVRFSWISIIGFAK